MTQLCKIAKLTLNYKINSNFKIPFNVCGFIIILLFFLYDIFYIEIIYKHQVKVISATKIICFSMRF